MGNWSGKWELGSTRATYQDLVTPNGNLNFKTVSGVSGVYRVGPFPGKSAASLPRAWKNCVLLERAGKSGPSLPTPLPVQPTAAQMKIAEKTLREAVKGVWLSPNAFERLEGDVENSAGRKRGVVLFRAKQAFADGGDILIAMWLQQLNGNTSPDGSAIGRGR